MAQFDLSQNSNFRGFLVMLGDPAAKDEIKLKAAQELSEHFDSLVQSTSYPSVLEHCLKVFLKMLEDGEPQFIQENTTQNIRKLILEMIHRLPICESLRQHVKPIISLMLKLLQTENEENVLVCLRIIIELHKNFRPSFNPEVQQFLTYVKKIYNDLPNHVAKIFEPLTPFRVKDMKDLKVEALLEETYTTRIIHLEKTTESGPFLQVYNLLPKGVLSLRVLQELPIIVVLIYQIYKNSVHQEVSEFVPLIMTTINLKPPMNQKGQQALNKEVFADFIGAQIKTLSFLAYVVRIFQDAVMVHSASVVSGLLSLMQLCPKEAAHLRKELLIAARHIFATDLRQKFIPCIDRLFDEDLLIGNGVTLDAIRPLAYSTLADLAHHVRQSLNLEVLELAANLFSKNVHDETLATGIQTMSCKLLLNLVDCIRQHSESNSTKARNILITLLKVFTAKFNTIAKIQLPQIMQKWKSYTSFNAGTTAPSSGLQLSGSSEAREGPNAESSEYVQKINSGGCCTTLNIAEYRSLVKTLVGGVKTITWGCVSCKPSTDTSKSSYNVKLFQPEELIIYVELVTCALEVLDIYTINLPNVNATQASVPRSLGHIPRTKEEKEVLEHFSGIFLMMHSQNFQEIFATTIDYVVERIYKNSSLQVIANSFLANPTTSPLFATVLVEYLLERMKEMGSNVERSNLYLRLFKLVFGSVSLFPVENEQMLRPHLHKIVNRSMELALTAEEPYNFFLLLRALFRSIGGGSHDLLYQEFLPLLPNLLEGLNRLQSGFHKQHMKDLFVELCLTVPVRLSSLLPYLPMLMDPLVSALNGSSTLISQGLRTLELCVDNLQPDFLYDHIQPVRAELMQALWRTLRNQDSAALVAFRVLGKFGGGNRKMMIEPQTLQYCAGETESPAVVAYFQDQNKPITLPVDKIIQSAFDFLNSHTTDSFYRQQSWQVIRCFLAASIKLDDDKHSLLKLFTHPSFIDGTLSNMLVLQFVCEKTLVRKTHQVALSGMLVASATKELRESVFPVMVGMVRHYTMVAIAQQAGPFQCNSHNSYNGIDSLVLIDVIAFCMGHEEKELCKPGLLCIALILETSSYLMGSKERACRLPIMQYLAEKMTALCYERPWYSKMGGCKAINWLCQNMSQRWIYQHLFAFLKAYMFVIMDLSEDVSNGTVDTAKEYMKSILKTCMIPIVVDHNDQKDDEIISIQNKSIYEVTHELVRQVTSPNSLVRAQAMSSLKLIAQLQKKTTFDIMDPHREVLADIIPPKKYLLRHQPASAQIGLMDGNTFCTTLEPRLFTISKSLM